MSLRLWRKHKSIFALYLFSITPFFIETCPAKASDTEFHPSLKLGWSLYGLGVSGENQESRIAGTHVEGELKHRFSPTLGANLRAGLRLEGGSSRAIYHSENAPAQGPEIREGYFHWEPLSRVQLSLGSLDQRQWEVPLLISDQSLPSLLTQATFAAGPWRFTLLAQQSYAADTSLSQTQVKWLEGVGQFYFERATLSFEEQNHFSSALHISHFLFENLSPESAYASRFSGNSTQGSMTGSSSFIYGYQGFEMGFQTRVRITPMFQPWIKTSALWNTLAPKDRNRAYKADFGITSESKLFKIRSSISRFLAESDASPSFFNARELGHNNVQGLGAAVEISTPNDSLSGGIHCFQSRPLVSNPYQSDLLWFQFFFRTQYNVL